MFVFTQAGQTHAHVHLRAVAGDREVVVQTLADGDDRVLGAQ